jgi:hypothetical protein
MPTNLAPVVAATTHWLVCAYPAPGGAFSKALAEAQARQAVTVAAWLRYPTTVDAALLRMVGPGGAGRLDWLVGADSRGTAHDVDEEVDEEQAWRSWVDEVVASWAACLLADAELASRAVEAVRDCEYLRGLHYDFRRLTAPDERDRRATPLLRHPDLLAPVADLHRAELLDRLRDTATGAEAA